MIIHLYALCWNEAKMLPFFFKHYDNIVDQYYIFDNDSTDHSVSMLRAHPKVNLNRFVIEGNSLVRSAQEKFNQFWKESREKADWIIVCDVDEHFYHPNLRIYLQECTSKGITLVVPNGYEMVSDFFPDSHQSLHETIRNGVRSPTYDKPQIFNPTEIQEINFSPGRHTASPVGNVIKPSHSEVLLLHYKYLGFDYVNSRFSALQQGLREGDIDNRWGFHYLWKEKQKSEQFEALKNKSVRVL
ncbi:hypothetical protein GCM10010912_25420 [Paenibacillus albidus]|uniref:Glycosyltransferase family 2 protein n=1 Tax=Paenibacillus albidus TaxID=2041023 RepID=A0A917C9A2_9BACL|nr:glycosyltransferase family 2 protein [Paenibacillus albidus]GGF79293.1 hypothetical protein GCM10010912_25420 [Paenibacillus albidus]